ncbi:hypothetical protein D187_005274 [Cystobacter fuscus DSM 2262]|uniref:Uncharacterized protein n=1 Tax=Cystobacter fuscus (strain ATCC 25194 / DSM 2262 / NBRC 100088 / M29) TaxID=1242864 RepID=S9PIL1_CYSF2|nr:hypothetical protein [Cystobacter fuscus]EPX64140.1 hypothetical protein D187_005274 [Cystobacter fuscus DSM 2262]
MSTALTAFSWGYEGWGNSTRELLQAFSAVERERGHGPPVFADVRVRREVRAVGFRGDAFAHQVGRAHYRWMPGLGNAAVGTGRGPMRLVEPAEVYELLGLIQSQARQGRRVIFFCSCGSPFDARDCHRQLVRRTLLGAARASRVRLGVQEWPGGALPSGVHEELPVTPALLAAVRAGAGSVRLGSRLPPVRLLGWPTGALLRLRAGEDTQLVSVAAAHFHAGEWKMPVYTRLGEGPETASRLRGAARRDRREGLLEAFPAPIR